MVSQRYIHSYKTFLLQPGYWLKANNPTTSLYTFTKIDSTVNVEPFRSVLPKCGVEILNCLYMAGGIKPHCCYGNSIRIATYLKKEVGLEIKCIDGYVSYRGGSCLHRFCQYEGRYFDATFEYIIEPESIFESAYYGVRSFDAQELLALMFGFGKISDSGVVPYYASSLSAEDERAKGNWDKEQSEIYLGDSGKIITTIG